MSLLRWADGLLIVSSAIIDLLAVYLLGSSIGGRSVRPFLGLLIVFGMAAVTAVPALVWLYVLVNQPSWARRGVDETAPT